MKLYWKILIIVLLLVKILLITFIIWLTTKSADLYVRQKIEEFFKLETNSDVKLGKVDISLPLILDIEYVDIIDQGGNKCEFKNLHLSLVPTIFPFWELHFWSVSSDEVVINQNFTFVKHKNNSDSFFNPDITIRQASIAKLTVTDGSKNIWGSDLAVNGHFEYLSADKRLEFALQTARYKVDEQIEVLGSYSNIKQLLEVKSVVYERENINISGNFSADLMNDKLTGQGLYKINIPHEILAENNAKLSINAIEGTFDVLGKNSAPDFSIKGQTKINDELLNYILSGSIRDKIISGQFKASYREISATSEIKYDDHKVHISKLKANIGTLENTADIVLDLAKNTIQGSVDTVDQNMGFVSLYIPHLKLGNGRMQTKFSLDEKLNQKAQIIAKIEHFKKEILSITIDLVHDASNAIIPYKFSLNTLEPINTKIESKGEVKFASDLSIVIDSISGVIADAKLQSSGKNYISLVPEIAIDLGNIKIDQGVISIRGEYKHQNISGNIAINNLPVENIFNSSAITMKNAILACDLKLSGTLDNLIWNGGAKFTGDRYEVKQFGFQINNITAKATIKDSIMLSELSAKDAFGNIISSKGRVVLSDKFPYNFELNTNQFNPINTPYIFGQVKGKLLFTGDINSAKTEGALVFGPAEIKIPDQFSDDIQELNIYDPEKFRNTRTPYPIGLNIDFSTSDKLFIRGYGVDSRLEGKLKVSGDISAPSFYGTLNSVRGRYQEFGKLLTIKKGELLFDGPISPSPFLNIVGVYVNSGNEIRVILSGSIFNPQISIESTPAMSQERALSFLLFGEHPEDISPFQALQLADGARRLSGQGRGIDPLGLGRKMLRVDDISLKTDNDNPENSAIGIGKYLTEKVYVEIERGRQADSTKLRVDVQLTPKISLENTTRQEGATSFGVNWRFDY